MYAHVVTLAKRMLAENDSSDEAKLAYPAWFFLASVAMFIVFFPIILALSYSLNNLYPTLAMIEDPSPPAYEPLSTATDGDDLEPATPKPTANPITVSIRRTTSLLRSIAGTKSLFRGFWCAFVAGMATSAVQSGFEGVIWPHALATLIAPLPAILITLPLSTAWTHIVMSAPKAVPWWRRIPSLRKTFVALWRPALVFWGAIATAISVPRIIANSLGLVAEWIAPNPNYGSLAWKSAVVGIVGLVLCIFFIIPAQVLFTRVQASLLPVEDDPIVAFDRSFAGTVEPEVVGGKGYANMTSAWKTFSKEAWRRLIILYVKVIGITFVAYGVMGAIFVPMFYVATKNAEKAGGN